MKIHMPEQVKKAISMLERNGYQAYIVGGCVRDSVMGSEPADWDITTSALPEQTKEVFVCERVIETGIKHGTVTVIMDKMSIEITTFRIDGLYKDNRHPEQVSFTDDIRNDLSRRDFTINAMAYNDRNGLIDCFGGLTDIKQKIIRCVGHDDKRFQEDALRIMRALRFASGLGFQIADETKRSIRNNRLLLKNIAVERISSELNKLLCGSSAAEILQTFSDVIFTVIPELASLKGCQQNCPYHIYDVWTHTVLSVSKVPKNKVLRLSMLFHDMGKPVVKTTDSNGIDHFKTHAHVSAEMAHDILRRMHYDNTTINTVCSLIKHHDDRLYNEPQSIKKHISAFGFPFLYQLTDIFKADIYAQNPNLIDRIEICDAYLNQLKKMESEGACFTIRDLEINGTDLKENGFDGAAIGKILNDVLNKVLENKLENRKQTLLSYVMQTYK